METDQHGVLSGRFHRLTSICPNLAARGIVRLISVKAAEVDRRLIWRKYRAAAPP